MEEVYTQADLTGLMAILAATFPTLAFIGLTVGGNRLGSRAGTLSLGAAFVSLLAAAFVFADVWGANGQYSVQFGRAPWFTVGGRDFIITLWIDRISAALLFVVAFVSALVQLYSLSYMKGEREFGRYFAYLSLFEAAMVGLVLFDSLILVYACWELVGLASYLLIGFWREKNEAGAAAKKAFLFNRVGDLGFLAGVMIFYSQYETVSISELNGMGLREELTGTLTVLASLGLFAGAAGKSAQLPLSVWLPDAMAGPTPASALIHAATMVAAGVYLLARCFFLLHPFALTFIACIGAFTAFLAAFAALSQRDIKKVLAYSTVSQLGYMVMSVGVGARDAALFHLLTHAFFKAGLFLAAGSVIHALHEAGERAGRHFDAQNMFSMGGLGKKMPVTAICFAVSGLALAGAPLFSGFLSKDAILAQSLRFALESGQAAMYLIPLLGFLASGMTAFYVMRQLALVFAGESRLPEGVYEQVEESSWPMRLPLVLLAGLSVGFVFSLNPLDAHASWLLQMLPGEGSADPELGPAVRVATELVSASLAFLGLWLGWRLFGRDGIHPFAQRFKPGGAWYDQSFHFAYIDHFHETVFNQTGEALARIAAYFDRKQLDRLIDFSAIVSVTLAHVAAWFDRSALDGLVNLNGAFAGALGRAMTSVGGGKVQLYVAFSLLVVLVAILTIVL